MKEAVIEAQIPPRSSIRQNSEAWRRRGEKRGGVGRSEERRWDDWERGEGRIGN